MINVTKTYLPKKENELELKVDENFNVNILKFFEEYLEKHAIF
ncbi:MAG: hypothetical protein P8Y46_08290 [Sulfurovaceae bacterium]|jgi:hypothetical protein